MNFLQEIFASATAALKSDFQALMRRIMLPIVLLLGGGMITQMSGLSVVANEEANVSPALVIIGMGMIAIGYLMLLVSVHRHVLSADSSSDGMGTAMFLYSTWSLGIGFIALLIALPLIALAGGFAALLAAAPVAYVVARLTLILPDRAIGRSTAIDEIWRYSQGNGWKLTMVIVGIPVIINILVSAIAGVLPVVIATVLASLLNLPILIFEAALVSIAYRDLRQLHATNSPPGLS